MFDDICALATSSISSAISIIRCSGPNCFKYVNKLIKKDIFKLKRNTITYHKLYYNNEFIDEVLISKFESPYSFDGCDMIEINVHGSMLVVNDLLNILLEIGFRLANPGEFSLRAFLNNKMDLTKAEGIMALISSSNNLAKNESKKSVDNLLFKKIKEYREKILDLITKIEVNIDYPEYIDELDVTNEYLSNVLPDLISEFKNILDISKTYEYVFNGLTCAIIGRPNVGKSSFLNALCGYNKAIVSNVAGTTRDVVEAVINLGDVSIKLLDTAGIRNTKNIVENIGINKSLELINSSDLVILILDLSRKLTNKDKELIEIIKNKNSIIVANKKDLDHKWENSNYLYINTNDNSFVKDLENKIKDLFLINKINTNNVMLQSARQYKLFNDSYNALINAYSNVNNDNDIMLIAIDLKESFEALGNIIGCNYPEEVITNLFSKFCLGK